LQLLARNYSNKEIAQSLGVSAETIKWRLKGLFSKLEAGSRKHAVVRARTLGMLSANR
jgi:LuxR family maltose regulon positive regulatory protein